MAWFMKIHTMVGVSHYGQVPLYRKGKFYMLLDHSIHIHYFNRTGCNSAFGEQCMHKD